MDKGTVIKRGVIVAAASALVAGYGCERPNPYKLAGDASAVFQDCPTPSTGSGNTKQTTTGGANPTSGASSTTGGANPTGGNTGASTGSGNGQPQYDQTELDQRVVDYGEALRTASILLVGDLPTLAQIDTLASLPPDQQKAQYEQYVDQMLSNQDGRFARTMIAFYRYTFKMGGLPDLRTIPQPSRETAPTFAARIVVEDKDWRTLLTQDSNTCPTYDPQGNTFTDGVCMVPQCSAETDPTLNSNGAVKLCLFAPANVPSNPNTAPAPMIPVYTNASAGNFPGGGPVMMPNMPEGKHSGILTNPGVLGLYWGNLAFRRQRFFHETFLCRSANEQSGAEPTDMKSDADKVPCDGVDPIQGYSNKWPANVIAGKCNGGRVDFHTYTNGNVCANCHATWNHRAPIWAQFDSQGMFTPGTFQVQVPVNGTPQAQLSDWLCIDPNKCPNGGQNYFAWKHDWVDVDGVTKHDGVAEGIKDINDVQALGKQMASDREVVECAVKRMWNYAMGRADITEIGGRSWVQLPTRKFNPDEQSRIDAKTMQTLQTLTDQFVSNGFHLKQVLRTILVSDDFVRF